MPQLAASFSAFSICGDAAGIAGNLFAFGLFMSPIPTFRRIIRSQATEQFSGLPHVRMLGSLFAVLAMFGIIVFASIKLFEPPNRQIFIGYLSVASLISMFASPIFIINMVIKTKNVEYMPFCLSLATLLMSVCFFAYGFSKYDLFISVPNGIGAVIGIVQLVLYFFYSRYSEEVSRIPLLESCA